MSTRKAAKFQLEALPRLSEKFGSRLLRDHPLARYTTARLGGPAAALFEARTVAEIVDAVTICWEEEYPLYILGGGSNVLISDKGFPGLVLINRTSAICFEEVDDQPFVWAETGVNFGLIARLSAQRGLSGLEWATSIPGTLGGAIVGNAGAFGGNMAGNLILAEILHHELTDEHLEICQEEWSVEKMEYAYRSSILKKNPNMGILLSASLKLERSTPEAVQAMSEQNVAARKRTQPPGASMGSMFKNPAGDYAGRLIEAAGLKGFSVGGAQISPLHANFFINTGGATAKDYYQLIQHARAIVADKFGKELELEVELLGEW